ncbi:MAG: tetratricopeptide repeat protein [Thermodesulfovibrionia bacterium]|nr:tetratricopeptide repeat protein [Thermodesulfovibrionia bacterium]
MSKISNRSDILIIGVTLFLSGFCGISYEVIYSRMLGNLIGDHFIVNASLLLTFLLGIGIGTKLAHRISRYLWAVEICIGFYAIGFTLLTPGIEAFLYNVLPANSIGMSVLASSILLAIPACLVGVSLPLFSAYLKHLRKGNVFAITYMIYNFGAAVTAIVIEFYLIRHLGIRNTAFLIGEFNLIIGLALFLRRRHIVPQIGRMEEVAYPLRVILPLIILSIASAVFQLLGLKIAEFIFGPFNETFAMVLGVVLFGIAFGTLLGRKFNISFAALLFFNLLYLTLLIPGFSYFVKLYAAYFSLFNSFSPLLWKIIILFLIMGPGTICFGAAIPSLIKQEENVAKESGHLLFVSSLANAAGYLLMVLVIHPNFEYGQIIVMIIFMLSAAFLITKWQAKKAAAVVCAAALAGVFLLHTFWNEDILYLDYLSFTSKNRYEKELKSYESGKRFKKYDETFAINRMDGQEFFFINGFTSIALNSAAEYIVGVLSSLPSHSTDSAMVLGLGSGATAGTVGQIFDHLDVVEISSIIIEKQPMLSMHNFDIASRKNVNIISDDGIRYTKITDKKYDLILNTVTSPLYFSSSKLYTVDFFRDVKTKLKKGGIYTTWLDSRVGDKGMDIILKSLSSEFKYCWVAIMKPSYFLLLCSDEPLKLRQEEKVFSNKGLKDFFLREHSIDIKTLRYAFVSANAFDHISAGSKAPLNTLDLPELEFEVSRLKHRGIKRFVDSIIGNYSADKAERNIFTGSPIDWYDLVTYYYQVDREFPYSRVFYKMAERHVEGFQEQFPSHILSSYRQAASEFPSSDRKNSLAKWLMSFDMYAEEEAVLREILNDDPGYYKIRHRIAKAVYWQGKYDEAILLFNEALKINPDNADTMFWLGRTYYKQKAYADSLKWFRRCLERDPQYDDANYYAGLASIGAGDTADAKAFFKRELVVDPEDKKPLKFL